MRLIIKNLSLGLIFYLGAITLGHFYTMTPDGAHRIELTYSFVTSGSLLAVFGPIKYAPLQSLLMAPFYAMGYYFGVLSNEPAQNMQKLGELCVVYLFLPIIISALCVLYFRILEKMGVYNHTNLVSTFLLFCATFFMPYLGGLFPDPLNALLILISFNYFYFAPATNYISNNRKNFLCLGLLVLNNFVFLFYFGLMVTYVFFASWFKRKNSSEAWRMALEGLLILGASVFLFLCYNYYRFGQFFDFGYGGESFTNNWMVGMFGLMVSLSKGLMIFSPLTVLCLIYFFFKYHEMESWKQYAFCTSLISFVCYLLIYSQWASWYGGFCWGPRFLLPFVPLIHLVLPDLLKSMPSFNRLFRAGIFLAVVLAVVLGVGMNLLYYAGNEVFVPMFYRNALAVNAEEMMRTMFFPKESAIFYLWENGLAPMKVLRFTLGLGLCASLLWIWKNRFLPRFSTS